MKPTRNKIPPKKTPSKTRSTSKDPVKVFCRLRPLQNGDTSCLRVLSPLTVSLLPPETGSSYRTANMKEIQYTFKHVFDDVVSQKEIFDNVGLPLVENLIHGKNGLLFTYGVTGSGKTFTMTGEPQNPGIMPRCLDVIFNSISNYQTKKYIFKPDRMNGFEVQSELDAMLDRQNELCATRSTKTLKKKESDTDLLQRSADSSKISNIEEDNMFAVFVTYVEIYNNAVYDLLEEVPEDTLRLRQLQVKIVREDAHHNMYVHSVTEVEVKSTEEAFELFYKGQKRKRMAITTLNPESSRSHSVFTIRLVQAPLDSQGENILQDRKAICISQLSLVDLAGSERTNRTKNSGQRLREAGNINNSLMTLRTCLEILRENQLYGGNKMVPYRDSKVTHLFKNYFDGDGQVEMIVCVNPRVEDYDETVHVMKFAEMTQEVQVSQTPSLKNDFGFTPGRRRANQIFKQALKEMDENGNKDARNIDIDIGLVYCLGPPFPSLELTDPRNDKIIKDLIKYLEMRINKRNVLLKAWEQKHTDFHNKLINVERENILATQECNSLRTTIEQERKKVSSLETRLMTSESAIMNFQQMVGERDANIAALRQELENRDMQLQQQFFEKEKLRQKYSDKIAAEKERNTQKTQIRLKEQEIEFKTQMKDQEDKLRKMKRILTKDTTPSRTPLQTPRSTANLYPNLPSTETTNVNSQVFSSQSSKRGPAVSNPRHRRSRSTGDEVWLDHRPATAVELGTVMQPYMKKRKSISKLTDAKDVANSKTSKYCLMTQEQDSSGELETRLYKADVVPTSGGGAQVIFNDIEMLKQHSPTSTPVRKRNASTSEHKDTQAVCSVAVEGHKRPRH